MNDFLDTARWLWAPVSAVFAWMLWSLRKATASFDDVLAIEKKIHSEIRRIDLLEGRIHCLPTKDSLHELKIQLVRLEEQHDSLQRLFNNRLEPIATSVRHIEEVLVKNNRLS